MASSSRRKLPLLSLLLAVVAVVLAAAAPAQAQPAQGYCRDTLSGLMECRGFMLGGAAAGAAGEPPSPACCAAYEAAFDAGPFCLCYVADGTFGRATGFDVDVARALRIPASCGRAAPPVELCSMEGLVLPPYAPEGTPAAAAAPTAQPPSARPTPPPSFASPPPLTSNANTDFDLEVAVFLIGFGLYLLLA